MVLEVNAAVRSAVAAGIGPAVLSAATVAVAGAALRRRLRAVWPKSHRLAGAAEDLLRSAVRDQRLPDHQGLVARKR